MKEKEVFGCLVLLFVKGALKNRITKVAYDTMKFGIINNRGAIVLKFSIDDTSFGVINLVNSPQPEIKSCYLIQDSIFDFLSDGVIFAIYIADP